MPKFSLLRFEVIADGKKRIVEFHREAKIRRLLSDDELVLLLVTQPSQLLIDGCGTQADLVADDPDYPSMDKLGKLPLQ